MDTASMLMASVWDSFPELIKTLDLRVILLVGSGLLAVALLVLSLTRWGQARPVWKCVVLSVVAHILLMGYAYGTHLVLRTPKVKHVNSAPVKISLVTAESSMEESADESAFEADEDSLSAAEMSMSKELELPRPAIDSTVELERTVAEPAETQLDLQPETPKTAVPVLTTGFKKSDHNPFQLPRMNESANPQVVDRKKYDDGQAEEQGSPWQVAENKPEKQVVDSVEPESSLPSPSTPSNDFVAPPERVQVEQPINTPSVQRPAHQTDPIVAATDAKPSADQTIGQKSDGYRLRIVNDNPTRPADGQPLPNLYQGRTEDKRKEMAKQRGGSNETEHSVEMGLEWLANHQDRDGRWNPRRNEGGQERSVYGHDRNGAGANADTGITGLALLAFLANGQSHYQGPYQKNVQKGLEFLVRNQLADGNLAGDARMFARMYCHSMALLAISEAYALTGDKRLLPAVQAGVNYSVSAQNRSDGGWRYQPGDEGDMSQFGWQVLALHSARVGGASVPQSAFDRMELFLDKCTSGPGKGLASYRPNQAVSTTMTAEALVCRHFLGQDVSPTTVTTASRRVLAELPSDRHVNLYYWYYGTLAMYNADPASWRRWNEPMKRALLGTQVRSGPDIGSWNPNGLWAGYGGRVYSTAMASLCLEVYYRYQPKAGVANRQERQLNIR